MEERVRTRQVAVLGYLSTTCSGSSREAPVQVDELLRRYRSGERDFVLLSLRRSDLSGIELYHINLSGSATDGDGFMQCTGWRVDLWAPTAKVNLGLAQAVTDETSINVPAHAAAEIKSPKMATLPIYIAQSCIAGSQIQITDPPKGHADALTSPPSPSARRRC